VLAIKWCIRERAFCATKSNSAWSIISCVLLSAFAFGDMLNTRFFGQVCSGDDHFAANAPLHTKFRVLRHVRSSGTELDISREEAQVGEKKSCSINWGHLRKAFSSHCLCMVHASNDDNLQLLKSALRVNFYIVISALV